MYKTEDVGRLLLAHLQGAFDLDNEYAPDSDMPKSASDKSKSCTNWAHKIDIERAWEFCNFGWPWEHVLTLKFGCEKSNADIAREMSMTKGEVNRIVDDATSELLDEMNTGRRRREQRDDAEQTRELNRLYQRAFARA